MCTMLAFGDTGARQHLPTLWTQRGSADVERVLKASLRCDLNRVLEHRLCCVPIAPAAAFCDGWRKISAYETESYGLIDVGGQ